MENEIFELEEIVWFQAYKEHEPIKGMIKKMGTLVELNRTFLPSKDSRVFYELHTVTVKGSDKEFKQTPFTITTAKWMKKI